jgi:hypothetical protein
MYQFARCQSHTKCPDLLGWYLILEPDDLDALVELHHGIANLYFFKFGMNPHFKPNSEEGVMKNPIRLAAMWLQTMEKFLMAGTTVLVNPSGGMIPYDESIVRTVVDREKMLWPSGEFNEDEVITISRWPRQRHYYLSSSTGRVFVPTKYWSHESAKRTAELYTNNIRTKENAGALPNFQ